MNDIRRSRWCWLFGVLSTGVLLASCGATPTVDVRGREQAQACMNASLTNPYGGGIGGTGSPVLAAKDPGGIGGTGQVALQPGFGGTGQVAAEGGLGGTGIVGVVTGFASICVNGLRVAYEPETAVWRDGERANTSVLAVGQLVGLQATREGRGLSAQRIDVLDAVVGPISALNRETGHIALVGQIAQAQEPDDLAGLAVGDWARVSGLARANGEIRATRVQAAAPGSALIRGKVSRLKGTSFMIGATRIEGSKLRWLPELAEGQEVLLRGQWDGMLFDADAGTREPTRSLIQRSQAVVLEGYVQRVRGQDVDLDYAGLTLERGVQVRGGRLTDLREGRKIQVHGRSGDGPRIVVDQLMFVREVRRGDGAGRAAGSLATKGSDEQGESDSDGSAGSDGGADDSDAGSSALSNGSGQGRGRGRGRGGRDSGDSSGSGSSGSGSSGSGSSGSGSSGSGSSGSGSSGSGSSGSGSSGSGSSGSGSSGSGSSGSGSSGSGSSGSGSSGSGSSGSGSSGSGSSGSGSSGGESGGGGRGRGRGRSD